MNDPFIAWGMFTLFMEVFAILVGCFVLCDQIDEDVIDD